MEGTKSHLIPALNLIRRLPPAKTAQNIGAIAKLRPDIEEELHQKIDKPLEIAIDTKVNKEFLKSEYNRDGDSFRSPFSNEYFPPLEKALYPSSHLRELEEKAQPLFEEYLRQYYENGLVSVFFSDKEDGGFAAFILIKKETQKTKGVESGNWDSINVVDVKVDSANKKANYKVTTTVILDIGVKNQTVGDLSLSGHITKQKEEVGVTIEGAADEFHLAKIGRLVEDNESNVKHSLENVYFGKTKQVIWDTRYEEGQKKSDQNSEKLRQGFLEIIKNKNPNA